MGECPFCTIIQGKASAVKLYEDEQVLGFFNENPINAGHTLVVPKTHHRTLFELPAEELKACILVCRRLGEAIVKATGAEGMNLVQNNHDAAGQSVDHVHFHLIPRHAGDGFVTSWSNSSKSQQDSNTLAQNVQEQLKAIPTAAL